MARPPSAEWKRALLAAAPLRTDAAVTAYSKLVAMVRGREGRAAFDALVASVRAPDDHGVYEGTHNAIWRFPPEQLGTWMADVLVAFQKRMGRHDQVHRFYGSLTTRKKAGAAFVAAVKKKPAAARRAIVAILRRWSIDEEDWEPVLAALGAPVAAPSAGGEPPASWPRPWRALHAEVRAGKKSLGDAWGYHGKPEAIPRVIAFMTIDPGPRWREIDALSNPVFISFAKKHYPAFVKQVRALPADEKTRLIAHLGRAAPWKRKQLEADLRAR